MLSKKTVGIAAACALALGAWSASAMATPITVGGVQWDPDSPFDLTIQSLNLRETSVTNVGDVLTGYGQVGSINGENNFCVGTGSGACDLTFTFSYTLSSLDTSTGVGIFNNGSFSLYVAPGGSYNQGDPSTAGVGTLWAVLTGHTGANVNGTGELVSHFNGAVNDPTDGSTGFGWLDATSGMAAPFLHSMLQSDGMGGFADFSLNSSFQTKPAKGCGTTPTTDPTNICTYPIQGNGQLIGQSVTQVPEPSELGLMGLGLGVLAFFFWRRRKEADERA